MASASSLKAGKSAITNLSTLREPGRVSSFCKLKVALLGDEWNSSKGGVSTLNRELAIHLAEDPRLDVTVLVPEGACKDEERKEGGGYGVSIVHAKTRPGYDPLDWLSFPPKDLSIDIVVGHGAKLGWQGQVIRYASQLEKCKWVQVVHTAPEDLGKLKRYPDPSSKGESKHEVEVDLCKRADLVVPVGPRLAECYSSYLRRWKKADDFFVLTPGLFAREFGDLEQVAGGDGDFRVLIVGRDDKEDFEVKGYYLAAKAFADHRLKNKPYELIFVGATKGKKEEVRKNLLLCDIAEEQLNVRTFIQNRDKIKDLLCEVDLAIMPSKSEGFGLAALEALSAGLPILVGQRSGIAKALEYVPNGRTCIVKSHDPAEWAKAIKAVRKRREMRLKEIKAVKESYGELYSWKKQCKALVEKMLKLFQGRSWNTETFDSSVDKHESATKTEQGATSSEKDLSQSWIQPTSRSTIIPGSTNVNSVSCLISAQELTCEKQEIIDEVLKRHVHLYTEHHKLSTPTDVVTFFEHTTKAYNLTVESLGVNRELCLESVSFNIGVEEGNYSIFRKAPTVPFKVQARDPVAIEAYNNALLHGQTLLKRVPILIIGQARAGKTSLKKSLKGEMFNPKEQSTVGIQTDREYCKVFTEAWKIGGEKNENDHGSEALFDHHTAQWIFGALKNVEKLPEGVPTSANNSLKEPSASSTESSRVGSDVGTKSCNRLIEEKVPERVASLVETMLENDGKVKEKCDIFSVIWDFGGQSVYYETHSIFLTQRAIYLLTCDLSRNPYEEKCTLVRKRWNRNKDDISCRQTNLDDLDFWLSSVYSLVSSNATPQHIPTVFLVCTHADKPYRETDPRALAGDIYEFLRAKPHGKHLLKDYFVVDNTKSGSKSECPEVVRLREELLTVAKCLPHMKEAVPLKWLKYENVLQCLRNEKYKYITIEKAREIASDKCGINDNEQFQIMLDFLHDQKVLIHFKETLLNTLVILDPQWLIDIFKKVITIRRYEPAEEFVEQFWLKLEATGILDERLLVHEWKSLIDVSSKQTFWSLLAIMERFSLLCPWPSYGEHNQYLVPSMLMSLPSDDLVELLSSVRIPSLFVRFELGRVPPGLFTRLVLQFYQWCNEEWESQIQPQLFRDFARFHILPDQGVSVIIMCHSSSIEIALHDGSDVCGAMRMEADFIDDYSNLATSRAIHWQLRLILESLRREFSWLKHMMYEMCVCCPVCSQRNAVRCRTHDVRGCECLHLLSESELQKCQYCTRPGFRGNRRICIKMFAPWFSFTVPEESRNPVDQQGASGCDEGELRSCITCKEEKSLVLPHDVLQCIQSQRSDAKEIVVQFQECLLLTPADLENPVPKTQRWIRCLANKAKSQNRIDVIEYLRTIAPAGTTGPLLNENLDVLCIPFKMRKELTFSLCGGEEWKQLAKSFGMSYNEIRFLDKRTTNPCDVVLDLIAKHRHLMVGELYDRLVMSGLPGSADLL